MGGNEVDGLTVTEFESYSEEVQQSLTLRFLDNATILSFWKLQADLGELEGDLLALKEAAAKLGAGTGEALVVMSVSKGLIKTTRLESGQIGVLSVDWRKCHLVGQVPVSILSTYLGEIDLSGNETTYGIDDIEYFRPYDLEKIGLGLTNEIETVVSLAIAMGSDRAMVFDSIMNPSAKKSVRLEYGYVTAIKWPMLNLMGSIPAEISKLQYLTKLILDRNNLTGEIPEELAYCVNMEYLDLRRNGLTGNIPRTFGMMESMKHFHGENNMLSGEVPAELGKWRHVTIINLENNPLLSNALPQEVRAITKGLKGDADHYIKI